MSTPIVESGIPRRATSSEQIFSGRGRLLGFYVSSTSGGTVVLRNGGSGGTQISGTITPGAGFFHPFPCTVSDGLYATISGTIDVTFFTQPGES